MRHSGNSLRLLDALVFAVVLCAFFAAIRVERIFAPELVPFAQVGIFAAVALLLMASSLRRGLARGAHLANTDELTGLHNRRAFTETLADHLFDHTGRGKSPALLLLDLDRFKLVNDTLGHPAGDDLLKVVALRLRTTIPPDAFVARLGGDEFAVIISVRGEDEAAMVAEDILRDLNRPVTVNGYEVWPHASIGIAVASGRRVPPGELLRMADVALYQAKGRGKGRAFLFDANARLPSISKLSMEAELHLALRSGQFEMVYQPVVDLKSRRIVGAEALLRWNHPSQGMLTPDAFLPLAAEMGIGRTLGQWIVEDVSEQTRTWQQLFGERIAISINISAAEFHSADFVYSLARSIRESGLDVHGLNFEVTEAALSADAETAESNLAELHRMGFKVAIDDFGIGLSSLNYLQTNRMDVLKLSPAFVRADVHNQRTFRIVRSIVDLAHSLGMTVVAEGVETEEQYQRMLQAGCDQGQGFYFARPMRPQELTQLLTDDQLALPVPQVKERRARNRPWSQSRPRPEEPAWDDLEERRGA